MTTLPENNSDKPEKLADIPKREVINIQDFRDEKEFIEQAASGELWDFVFQNEEERKKFIEDVLL